MKSEFYSTLGIVIMAFSMSFGGFFAGAHSSRAALEESEAKIEVFNKMMRGAAQPYCIANADELDMGGTQRMMKVVTQASLLDEIEVKSVMVDEESIIALKGMKFERRECGWMVVSGINVVWAEKADLMHRFKK